ncbi:tRNA-guanine transglycosylase [Lentithecium fluviatile CBS 122367]|uniref:tRNA-guanine transglycosylase n=1 Tax=Lentithecium fluviatile CBS 122367 TaxID=1168545 RepID=A0A6G1J2A1_9PLEO|nr:tRNA-guanine transglycosylase [Lentithecium fluviatile CBS 122367]
MLLISPAAILNLGRLALTGRKPILTPGFIENSSRGVVPHVLQDNFRRCGLNGVYVALEDFVKKHPQMTPPIFQLDAPNALRKFAALPQDSLLVLGARRNPPIASPSANTNTETSLLTSVGYKYMRSDYYAAAVRNLQPDIVIGLADIPFGQAEGKMSDRTETWLRDVVAMKSSIEEGEPGFHIFAPILPIDRDLQLWYLEHLLDDVVDKISGVAIHDAYLPDDLPGGMRRLPRLSFHDPASPQELLRQVSLDMDIFTSLGIDMWYDDHALSVTQLSESCTCYACSKHHRAYVQHLLSAKEMLGWVLIQLHNHTVLDAFFAGVRNSIRAGTFDADAAAYHAFYEPQLPERTGQGPRVRGYQFRSEDHAKPAKKNPKPAMRDVIDDEALVGLVGMEDAAGEVQLENLDFADDKQ